MSDLRKIALHEQGDDPRGRSAGAQLEHILLANDTNIHANANGAGAAAAPLFYPHLNQPNQTSNINNVNHSNQHQQYGVDGAQQPVPQPQPQPSGGQPPLMLNPLNIDAGANFPQTELNPPIFAHTTAPFHAQHQHLPAAPQVQHVQRNRVHGLGVPPPLLTHPFAAVPNQPMPNNSTIPNNNMALPQINNVRQSPSASVTGLQHQLQQSPSPAPSIAGANPGPVPASTATILQSPFQGFQAQPDINSIFNMPQPQQQTIPVPMQVPVPVQVPGPPAQPRNHLQNSSPYIPNLTLHPPVLPSPHSDPLALNLAHPHTSNRVLDYNTAPAPNDPLAVPFGQVRELHIALPTQVRTAHLERQPQQPHLALPHSQFPVPLAPIFTTGFTPPLYPPSTVVPAAVAMDYLAPPASTSAQMFESNMTVAYAYRNIGRHDLAAESFRAAACLRPDSSEARSCYALASHEQGMFDTAVTEFNVALSLGANFPDDVYNNLGNTYRAMGMSRDAEIAYRAALGISPRHAHAWNNLGNAMRGQGKLDDAMDCYTSSLNALPDFAPAHCNLAGLLRDQGKSRQAEAQYRAALASDPNLAEAAAGLGTALRDMGRAEEAINFYIRAVGLQPNAADHRANLANTYKDLNRIEESITSYQAALELQPDIPDAFCNMVHSLSVICDWRNRKENFRILLSIVHKQLDALLRNPNTHPRLVHTLAGALTNSTPKQVNTNGGSRSERESSVLSREKQRPRHPSSPISSRSGASSRVGVDSSSTPTPTRAGTSPSTNNNNNNNSNNYTAHARKVTFSAAYNSIVSPVLTTGLPSVQPFHALIYPMTPEKFKALAAAYASRAELMVQGLPHARHMYTSPSQTPLGKLKVGYVSSDYNNHPYSHLTQSVYGLHRGSRVECFCYALTPSDGSAWRHRIETEVENFRDISALSAQQSAQAISNDGIHVLVNCNGYTKGARTELFALRPAPVQVSFMGFAGTLGAHYIEYFLTDTMTSPPHLANRMHSESLLYHPHTYFVNDHKQTSHEGPANYPGGPLTRVRYGLPDCFLFIMHNQVYKIDPATFDVWARILKRVPHSKLWLLRFPPSAESRIREEARLRGLGPDRILFTDVAAKEEHVARCGLGDLFLDTPTCNAHTTGTDALWSGIPLITCPGSLFASRVAASLLRAAGLHELICADMKEYEELAVELALNPERLRAIRNRLERSRRSNPLFDTARWVRNVEELYWKAWIRFESGQAPDHIYGEDVYEKAGGMNNGVNGRYIGNGDHVHNSNRAANAMVESTTNNLTATSLNNVTGIGDNMRRNGRQGSLIAS